MLSYKSVSSDSNSEGVIKYSRSQASLQKYQTLKTRRTLDVGRTERLPALP